MKAHTPAPVSTVTFPAPKNAAIRLIASVGVMTLVVLAFDNTASGMVGTEIRICDARVYFLVLHLDVFVLETDRSSAKKLQSTDNPERKVLSHCSR